MYTRVHAQYTGGKIERIDMSAPYRDRVLSSSWCCAAQGGFTLRPWTSLFVVCRPIKEYEHGSLWCWYCEYTICFCMSIHVRGYTFLPPSIPHALGHSWVHHASELKPFLCQPKQTSLSAPVVPPFSTIAPHCLMSMKETDYNEADALGSELLSAWWTTRCTRP